MNLVFHINLDQIREYEEQYWFYLAADLKLVVDKVENSNGTFTDFAEEIKSYFGEYYRSSTELAEISKFLKTEGRRILGTNRRTRTAIKVARDLINDINREEFSRKLGL
jgi:hypothetical protein